MKASEKNTNISLPKATFQKMLGAMTAVEDAKEHLENFLILSNPKIMGEVRRAKLDYQKGRVGSWTALKKRYGV